MLVFVLSIYMLIYGPRIGDHVRSWMPPGDGSEEDDYPSQVQHAVVGYVRAQFLFSLLMGLGAGIGLYIFGVLGIFPSGKTYAVAFGVFFGITELIPFIGPFLGALPPVLVALFQDPLSALWVALLFLGLQQIEGHVVAPQVFGHSLRINPILVIFALLVGGAVAGFIGALIALPTAAVIRETVIYLRRHLVFEPWGDSAPLSVIGAVAASRAPTLPELWRDRRLGRRVLPVVRDDASSRSSSVRSVTAISARGVTKHFGSRAALRDVNFDAEVGERLAVIGPNGAGKTTLLSILAGIQRADEGEVQPAPRRGRVGAPAGRGVLEAVGVGEPAPVRPPGEDRRRRGGGRADARPDGAA